MTSAKRVAAVGAVIVALGAGMVVLNNRTAAVATYNYCTDAVYYVRSCESSPYSVAAGTPGYSGQICGAHTWAWRGDDLFTYALMDQGGKTYKRPPASAGAALLKVYDDCYVKHLDTWPMGSMCLAAVQPGGTQQYFPIKWAQLPEPQKTAYGNKYGCFSATPSPSPSSVPPVATATPITICPTQTPPPCPTAKPCNCPPTPTPHIGPNQ